MNKQQKRQRRHAAAADPSALNGRIDWGPSAPHEAPARPKAAPKTAGKRRGSRVTA